MTSSRSRSDCIEPLSCVGLVCVEVQLSLSLSLSLSLCAFC